MCADRQVPLLFEDIASDPVSYTHLTVFAKNCVISFLCQDNADHFCKSVIIINDQDGRGGGGHGVSPLYYSVIIVIILSPQPPFLRLFAHTPVSYTHLFYYILMVHVTGNDNYFRSTNTVYQNAE